MQRMRGERLERSNAHMYETGGMRRTHLRGHENIMKRLIVHAAAFNLGMLLRQVTGIGKPRRLQDLRGLLLALILWMCDLIRMIGKLVQRPTTALDQRDRIPRVKVDPLT